jgi:hypothetical protein
MIRIAECCPTVTLKVVGCNNITSVGIIRSKMVTMMILRMMMIIVMIIILTKSAKMNKPNMPQKGKSACLIGEMYEDATNLQRFKKADS